MSNRLTGKHYEREFPTGKVFGGRPAKAGLRC
jgi:hypothetical protein